MTQPDCAPPNVSERVLVLVRGARNCELTVDILARGGFAAIVCADPADLCAKIEEGGATALLDEEVLTPDALEGFAKTLARQPPWSDFPIVVFSGVGAPARGDVARILGNVTFLDRPVRTRSMIASVNAALRSRRRQYEGRRAIESRDTFLAMLGHELRNPLGAIRLAVAMIERKGAAAGREIEIIDRQARHLTRLVDDLLDVARVTQGKVVLKTMRLNVVDAARSAFEAHEARARERSLSFDFVAPPVPICVEGDRQRLEQVFANLITNAIKYTPRGGAITVSVGMEDDSAVVTVADTGVGIAPEMLERVFDAFAQADRTLDRTEGGIGLGLALARSLVQLHKGTIESRSAGVGRGSTFVVRVPVAPGAVPAAVGSQDDVSGPGARRRVVVVEDASDIRELIAELLHQDGHDVWCAEDGPEGLQKILEIAPDIAFVDLGLPGFDGLELARRARASGSTTRLVAVTGYGQPEDRTHARDAGFDDHLTKPVIGPDLHRAMQNVEAPISADAARP